MICKTLYSKILGVAVSINTTATPVFNQIDKVIDLSVEYINQSNQMYKVSYLCTLQQQVKEKDNLLLEALIKAI